MYTYIPFLKLRRRERERGRRTGEGMGRRGEEGEDAFQGHP
jgi:hypothetical protein